MKIGLDANFHFHHNLRQVSVDTAFPQMYYSAFIESLCRLSSNLLWLNTKADWWIWINLKENGWTQAQSKRTLLSPRQQLLPTNRRLSKIQCKTSQIKLTFVPCFVSILNNSVLGLVYILVLVKFCARVHFMFCCLRNKLSNGNNRMTLTLTILKCAI